jgi:hypothetical protein|tara:strand:- start:659 stop:1006 length:348 start_codon:yes stop_codon:yes gene_type:complete
MDKGKKIVSKNTGKGRLASTAGAIGVKAAKGGSRGGGSKSSKSKTVSPRLTQRTRRKLLEQPDPASAFKDLQARRTMQDKPAALSIMREKRPYRERAMPPIPTKGGKTGLGLYRG